MIKRDEMTARRFSLQSTTADQFISAANVELNRAERYRVFISLTIFDLGFLAESADSRQGALVEQISESVRDSIRACDYAALLDDSHLAVLFPETPRQGAETAVRRLTGTIRDKLKEVVGEAPTEIIPVEMASYPDTAGAKALTVFLKEFADKRLN